MMSAAWASLALVLTLVGALYTWWAWRTQGWRGLVRGTGITLLPVAAWLTGTLRLAAVVTDWLLGWATGLVLSPAVLVGTALFAVAAALLALSHRMTARAVGAPAPTAATPRVGGRTTSGRAGRRPAPAGSDPDLDDIEALLRKRGIS